MFPKKKIKKILIANRGEIALRIIRACKELGYPTVSIYSTADESSLHRNFSDESVCIGEAPTSDSYLNMSRIIAAAEITGACAIHPGYGFLSENPSFSKICENNKIKFIGPSEQMIADMGDKSKARENMLAAGIPVLPGTKILANEQEALAAAKTLKYPIILKATAGGGGRGMRICKNAKELEKNFSITRNEARIGFGNPDVYMEKYINEPHHIEVQLICDSHGNAIHLGERDCSIQRRHQKLIEETPSPFIDQTTRDAICLAAVKGAKYIKYEGVGTIEFLVDEDQNFYFMEMNTRIQVEHTISELYTGMDIVKEQIRIAEGSPLSIKNQKDIIFRGHVIECRINAEDPKNDFSPCPGNIGRYHVPQGLGVRVDSHVYDGYEIPPNYDSMIAKLIVWGINRDEAIQRMQRSLNEMIIEGIKTTIPFHSQVIQSKAFQKGKFSTHFLKHFKYVPQKES